MKKDVQRALRLKELSEEIVQTLLKDDRTQDETSLRQASEFLARAVNELANIYMDDKEMDHDSVLKGTVTKLKIAHNCLNSKYNNSVVLNESVL